MLLLGMLRVACCGLRLAGFVVVLLLSCLRVWVWVWGCGAFYDVTMGVGRDGMAWLSTDADASTGIQIHIQMNI